MEKIIPKAHTRDDYINISVISKNQTRFATHDDYQALGFGGDHASSCTGIEWKIITGEQSFSTCCSDPASLWPSWSCGMVPDHRELQRYPNQWIVEFVKLLSDELHYYHSWGEVYSTRPRSHRVNFVHSQLTWYAKSDAKWTLENESYRTTFS